MKKIIKHGKKVSSIFVCPVCGCEFEADSEDMTIVNEYMFFSTCPECGNTNVMNEETEGEVEVITTQE